MFKILFKITVVVLAVAVLSLAGVGGYYLWTTRTPPVSTVPTPKVTVTPTPQLPSPHPVQLPEGSFDFGKVRSLDGQKLVLENREGKEQEIVLTEETMIFKDPQPDEENPEHNSSVIQVGDRVGILTFSKNGQKFAESITIFSSKNVNVVKR